MPWPVTLSCVRAASQTQLPLEDKGAGAWIQNGGWGVGENRILACSDEGKEKTEKE